MQKGKEYSPDDLLTSILPQYSDEDLFVLGEFMHEDFAGFTVSTGRRDPGARIEWPDIAEWQEFRDKATKALQEELGCCHPLLRRRRIIVRFVPELFAPKLGVETPGECLEIPTETGKREYWIRASLANYQRRRPANRVPTLVGSIVHELAEMDYYLKSPAGTVDDVSKLGTREHDFNEDEKVANRRAVRAIQIAYGITRAGWEHVQYEEDKD